MVLPTKPETAPVATTIQDLPLKHHKSVKEEITNLLEAGFIERSLSSYVAKIIVVPCIASPGSSLPETKRYSY